MANKTETLCIRVNPELKRKAQETLEDLGMNIAEAVTIFLNQVVMNDGIPFKITKPRLNAETVQAIKDVEDGVGLSKEFTDLEELWDDLEI